MTYVLVLFALAATVLWLSIYGYLLLLAALAYRAPRRPRPVEEWPDVAVVIPTLNEEHTIADKLADLARIDYPAAQLRVVVIDGGSADRTVDHVRSAIAAGAGVELWQVAPGNKVHQVNSAMERLGNDLVVVTDADARLDPACVRELVAALLDDPQTAIIGASVRVATDLPEERLHWWGINALWWLEGEALSAAVVSGVCYAARRTALLAAFPDARAEDVHLALRAAGQGMRVRISRTAWATEVRVPHDARQLLRFRRRRGADYLRELRRAPAGPLPIGVRVARWVRLFHFRATPFLAIMTASLALVLLGAARWYGPLVAGLAFALPCAVVLSRSGSLRAGASAWSVMLAAGRLIGLLWLSLLTLRASGGAAPAPAPERATGARPYAAPPAARIISVDPRAG